MASPDPRRRRPAWLRWAWLMPVALLALAGLTSVVEWAGSAGAGVDVGEAGRSADSGHHGTARHRPPTPAQRAYARMTPRERVGQLLMFGVTSTGASADQLQRLHDGAAGNVFLRGPSGLGVTAMRRVTTAVADATTTRHGVRPFVSVDQEGGFAQSLKGPGFSTIPTALDQGGTPPARLRRDARTWAAELRTAGVNLDLAPVTDVVPASVGFRNAPIGYFHREYGTTADGVGPHVAAVVAGMRAARVATSLKHFPGLGRASGNTDSDPDVTDPTTPRDPLLGGFTTGIRAGAPMVMVSSAFYPAISDGPRACFNARIMRDLLRRRLGFDGVIVSDSFGSASVAGTPPGERAVRFFRAGGTLLLDTNILDLAPMARTLLAEAEHDRTFARTLERDVLRVLAAKDRFGLLGR